MGSLWNTDTRLCNVYLKPDLHSYILPERIWFDKNHFIISMVALVAAICTGSIMKTDDQPDSTLKRLQSNIYNNFNCLRTIDDDQI